MKELIQQIINENSEVVDNHPVLKTEIIKQKLIPIINHLMDTNFSNFVQLLYLLDVDEKKVTALSKTNSFNAEEIVDLIIEREKRNVRNKNRNWEF